MEKGQRPDIDSRGKYDNSPQNTMANFRKAWAKSIVKRGWEIDPETNVVIPPAPEGKVRSFLSYLWDRKAEILAGSAFGLVAKGSARSLFSGATGVVPAMLISGSVSMAAEMFGEWTAQTDEILSLGYPINNNFERIRTRLKNPRRDVEWSRIAKAGAKGFLLGAASGAIGFELPEVVNFIAGHNPIQVDLAGLTHVKDHIGLLARYAPVLGGLADFIQGEEIPVHNEVLIVDQHQPANNLV